MYLRSYIVMLTAIPFLRSIFNLSYSIWIWAILIIVVINRKWLKIAVKLIGRDIRFFYRFLKMYTILAIQVLQKNTLHKVFLMNVRKFPQKICLKFEDENWTFQDVEDYSNRVARFFKNQGCKPGDVIALLMEPSPKYICTWLGLAKIGCTSSLINLNLRQEVLQHSLIASGCASVLLGTSFVPFVEEIYDQLNFTATYYIDEIAGTKCKFPLVEMNLQQWPCTPVEVMTSISVHDPAMHIYTSGTTGKPKPAVISHMRCIFMSYCLPIACALTTDDVLYNPLPLYHSVGGMLSVGQALVFGSTVVIKAKFSASEFWDDCIKYKATSAQYVGEICRYLLSQPSRPCDRSHSVTRMCGNGLRKELWGTFQKRFGVNTIHEFYGSTEGNCSLINSGYNFQSIGFVPFICPSIYPITLIKIDEDTLQPLRDKNGLCIKCAAGEPGEVVGKISNHALRRFDGYMDKSETAKKIIYSVNKANDKYFRSGDLLIRDEEWNFYFHDRMGDTYRWRGENVSTTEIEGVLSGLLEGSECIVYGVQIPGYEGRAGMAAIVDPDRNVDVKSLSSKMIDSLPSYARPVFLRMLDKVEMTSTYKHKKSKLKKLGFALVPGDTVYFKRRNGEYELVDELAIQHIININIVF